MQDAAELIAALAASGDDPSRLLAELSQRCLAAGAWRELFECRLLEARRNVGVPVDCTSILTAPKDKQGQLEQAYHAACVEAGDGLLAEGLFREAWRYLKAIGDDQRMRSALAGQTISDDNTEEQNDELIELALHEGVYPELGFRWLLERFGTCNAVTTLDGMGPYLSPDDVRPCVEVLLEWITDELTENVRAHVERHEGSPPAEKTLPALMEGREWLFAQEGAHVDASHLAAAVRWARVLQEPDQLRRARDLAAYGTRLYESLQYPEAPPFEATYPAHLLYFQAQLGHCSDEAATYFRTQAEQHRGEPIGGACAEAYLQLLARLGRGAEALAQYARLVDDETPLSLAAPPAD